MSLNYFNCHSDPRKTRHNALTAGICCNLNYCHDEGKTWKISKEVYAGKDKDAKSPAAFSDIITLD